MYVYVPISVSANECLNQGLYLQLHLGANLLRMFLCVNCLCGLGAKIDKDLCLCESMGF